MWRALGLADLFVNHDDYVTIGENIGRPDCTIPACGIEWLTTPQPIALDHWPLQTAPDNGKITSIGSWRGAYGRRIWRAGLAHTGRGRAGARGISGRVWRLAIFSSLLTPTWLFRAMPSRKLPRLFAMIPTWPRSSALTTTCRPRLAPAAERDGDQLPGRSFLRRCQPIYQPQRGGAKAGETAA
jgi:hypothetical protein